MLLIRETARLVSNLARFSLTHRGAWLLLAIVLGGVIAAVATSVTVVGPVVIYPFL